MVNITDNSNNNNNSSGGKVEIHQESFNIFKSRFFDHVSQQYYILNGIFLLLYPILRLSGLILKPANEIMVLYVSFFMVILKVLKNKNLDQILTNVIFTLKMSTIVLLYYSGEATFKLNYLNSIKSNNGSSDSNGDEEFNLEPKSTGHLGFVANLFHVGFFYVLAYVVLWLLLFIYKSQPEPKQSNNVHLYNQLTFKNALRFSSESKQLKDKYLLVEFFTTWSPPCTYLASTFSDISYVFNGINFGKIDIGRWKNIAFEYDINDSISSKQIPSLILFKNGVEMMRLPYRKDEFQLPYDKSLKKDEKLFVGCNFSFDDIKNYFNLEKLSDETKSKSNTVQVINKSSSSSSKNNNKKNK